MSKTEFLNQLRRKLSSLPKEERESAIEFYENYFNDAQSEQDAIKNLGSVDEIAANLIIEFGENQRENTYSKKAEKKSNLSWITVLLAILSAPITLPLGLAGIILIGSFIFTVILMLFSIGLLFFAFLAGAFISLFAIIPAFLVSFPTGCFFLGFFLSGTAFAYFSVKLLVILTKKCVLFLQDLISKLLRKKYKPANKAFEQ